jgi:tRNA A-37 threonylcarbamoyl transferase component Bud32
MSGTVGADDKRAGSYAVHAEIGAGGMATVHLGRFVGARGFARTVAIKVLHESYAKNKAFVARFVDEARLVARIHHPNVMPTLDVVADGDDLRIVMEYVAGEALDQLQARMKERGERIPVPVACAIIAGVLHGLHAAHEAKNEFGEPLGIVHLDVSPQNVLVGTDGTTRVLDFGVARARGDKASAAVSGKSAYLAPEQVRGAEVSPRTDVFAASIVLWEMLTGEPLFAADNHAATLQRVLGCVIPAVSDKVPDLPARLDEVLKVGLRRDPAQRFATARDMALELEQSVVPALASEVGRWVESTAEATLVARAAKVREMEAGSASRVAAVVGAAGGGGSAGAGAMPGLVATRELYDEQAAVNLPSDVLIDGHTGSLMRPASDGLVPERAKDGSIRWKPRSTPPPARRAAPTPKPAMGKTPTSTRTAQKKSRRLLWVGLGGGVVALVVFVFGARALALPGYVRGNVIDDARAHGVLLTVGDASLSDDGVLLRDVTAKLAGVPGARAAIASADVRIGWGLPTKILLGKTDVVVDGDVDSTLTAIDAWSASQRQRHDKNAKLGTDSLLAPDEVPGGQIEIPSAHLVWTHPSSGDITRIEATGLQGAVGSPTARSLTDEAHLLTTSLVIETRVGTFGPWNLDIDSKPSETRARLAFDPAVPDGANVLGVLDASGGTSLDVTIPRLPVGSLGVPATALGKGTSLPQQVELLLHYGRTARDENSGSLKAAFYGVHVPELGTSVDVHVSGLAEGPSGDAMTVKDGVFSLGPVRGKVTGTVTPEARAVAMRLAWRAEPMPCASLVSLPSPRAAARDVTRQLGSDGPVDLGDLARDLGSLGQAWGALKVTGSFLAAGTVTADSADPGQAKFTMATKNACGIALFQGK